MTTPGSSSSSGSVKTIETWRDLMTTLKVAESNSTMVVLEFMATWSEPSRNMEQPYKDVANDFRRRNNLQFAAVDFDKFKNLGRRLRVEVLPTFLLVKNFRVEDRIVALNKNELSTQLTEKLDNLTASTTAG